MTPSRARILAAVATVATVAALAASAALAVPPASAATPRKGAGSAHAASPAVAGQPPFARVYLALRGCTSCSHCRTTIRQMVRSNAKGGEATLSDDKVEVRYVTPRPVPLREVIRSLADNRLHDMSVVDVLFEAEGTLSTARDGAATFTLAETGQSFPVAIGKAMARPVDGRPVRITAVVDGWRARGALSLVAREVKEGA